MPEIMTIEIASDVFEAILKANYLRVGVDYNIKTIKVKDDFFKNDERYAMLKKIADKAYKELEEYQFKKRHNIPE